MRLFAKMHKIFVHGRRVRITAQLLAEQIPANANVLDVGCGDGSIASQIARLRQDVRIRGVEIMPRAGCKVQCDAFDGFHLPFNDDSFDVCMMVDVLHHTKDVTVLLREASRVSKSIVLLRDHLSENALDHLTLKALDWAGNRPHGVKLTYNYQGRAQWERAFTASGLTATNWSNKASTYLPPISWVAGRNLHFIAILEKRTALEARRSDSVQSLAGR